jgi:vitamin B12 transporter
MKTICIRLVTILYLSFVVCFSSPAQGNSAQAQLSGRLVDSSGAGVGGVAITVSPEKDPAARNFTASSSDEGAYSFALPPGSYRLRFQREGFATRELIVVLAANEQRKLDLRLNLERLSASVVVTAQVQPTLAEQTTAPTTVITKAEIDSRQSVDLPTALLFTPGVAIGRTGPEGGTASVFLNGGNSNFVKVLVDGAPINPPGAAVDFSDLTLDNIDKVEIVRGAESALYGTDAVSGVIQLFTHRGETRIPEFSVFAEGGDFSSGRGGGEFSGLFGAFDYSAAASYFSTAGQGPDDDFLNRTFSGNFGYKISDTNQLRLSLRNTDSIAGIPGQTLLEPVSGDRYTQHIFSASARWEFTTGRHWRHEISGGESYTNQLDVDPLFGNSTFQYNRASVNAQTSYILADFAVTAGYQYEVENAFLTSIDVPHARRNNQAGYLDFRYRPHRRISLNFGGRAEDNGYFGTRVVPRVGAAAALHYGKGFWGDTVYRAFSGEGIKEPRFDQTFGDNFGDFGNPSLKPEASKTWSTGIEQKLIDDRLRITAEYFSSRFYDVVSFEFCTPNSPPQTGNTCGVTIPGLSPGTSFGYYFNTDLARARGVNFAAEARLNRWLKLAGNYTYDDTLVIKAPNAFDPTETAGNRLLRRPPNSGSLTLNAAFRRLNVLLDGYFTGVRTDSDFLGLGLTRNPGYARFDMTTSYRLGHGLSLYGRAENLLNRSYQDAIGYPALGRDVHAGVRYTFSGRD